MIVRSFKEKRHREGKKEGMNGYSGGGGGRGGGGGGGEGWLSRVREVVEVEDYFTVRVRKVAAYKGGCYGRREARVST